MRKLRVNGLGFFAPIFSRWTGLKFVEIYEKKIEKLKKLSFGCHFGRKRREKSREISVKFENLEKKMSEWTRLFPVDGLKTKIIL